VDIITKIEQFLIISPPKEKTEYDEVVLAKQGDLLRWGDIYIYHKPGLIITPGENKFLIKTEWGEFIEEKINIFGTNKNFVRLYFEIGAGLICDPSFIGSIMFRSRKSLICA